MRYQSVPSNCVSCGLYKNARTPKMGPHHSKNPHIPSNPSILVVLKAPFREDDELGPFQSEEMKFLEVFLRRLEYRWAVEYTAKCHPGDTKVLVDKHVPHCSPFFTETLQKTKPSVIICLGSIPMQAVLGARAPKTIAEAKKFPMRLEDGTWVLVEKDPVNHITGKEDLKNSYIRLFTQAQDLITGKHDGPVMDYEVIRDPAQALAKLPYMASKDVSFDVEVDVSDIDPAKKTLWHPEARLLSCSFTYHTGPKQYQTFVLLPPALTAQTVEAATKNYEVVGHNIKYDLQAIYRFLGVDILRINGQRAYDTFLYSFLRDMSGTENSLKKLASAHFAAPPWNHEVWEAVRVANQAIADSNKALTYENKRRAKEGLPALPKQLQNAGFGAADPEVLAKYNAFDTWYTARLRHEVLENITTETLAARLVHRATYALALTERRGLPVDTRRVQAMLTATNKKIERITSLLTKQPEIQQCKIAFNVRSSPFILELKEITNTPTLKTNWKTGKPKMDKEVMQQLAGVFPRIPPHERTRQAWLWYYVYHLRQHYNLVSRGLTDLTEYPVYSKSLGGWRIHTSYKLGKSYSDGSSGEESGGTETGRLASSDPNIQNLKKDKVFRSCFRAMPGWLFAELDYDRIELVVLAWISKAKKMMEALEKGIDLHELTTRLVFKIPDNDAVPKEYRDLGKRANFAIVYGETPESFSERNNVDIVESYRIFDNYWENYPEVLEFYQKIDAIAKAGEPVTTLFGRARYFNLTGDEGHDSHLQREWRNFVIQSVASDITLWKLCDVYDWMAKEGYHNLSKKFHPINAVHDSLWLEFKRADAAEILPAVMNIMKDTTSLPIEFKLPLGVSCAIGDNLGDMHEVPDWRDYFST